MTREISLAEAMTVLETIQLDDLRKIDAEEFTDAMGKFPLDVADFPVMLMSLMGMTRLSCRVLGHFYNNDLAFMASSSFLSDGTKLLCGFAVGKYEPLYGVKDRLEIVSDLLKVILIDDECQEFKCYVKDSNTDTLKMWRLVGKQYSGLTLSFSKAIMSVPDYTLVSIRKDS